MFCMCRLAGKPRTANQGPCRHGVWASTGPTLAQCFGGYRGNAKNLDLNRDFVKMDTENAKSFAEINRTWRPHVFLDTHTTNGSDHQYSITLIPAQHNSMQQDIGDFFSKEMIPDLYRRMLDPSNQ